MAPSTKPVSVQGQFSASPPSSRMNDNQPPTRPLEANINDVAAPTVQEEMTYSPNPVHHRQTGPGISSAITRRLYTSHLLSTWNSRSFEFGAVLFLASAFPGTLLPLSIYALVRSASAILLAPTVGRAIDRKSRLPVVRFSIGKPCRLPPVPSTNHARC